MNPTPPPSDHLCVVCQKPLNDDQTMCCSAECIEAEVNRQRTSHRTAPPLTCTCGWKGTHEEAATFAPVDTREFCPRCHDNGYMVKPKSALPLPEEDPMDLDLSDVRDAVTEKVARWAKEDAKTEGETPITDKWSNARGLTISIKEAAEFARYLETLLAGARAEVDGLRKVAGIKTIEIKGMLSELTALREENKRLREWQPIRTAPKDRGKVDLLVHGKRKPDCSWNGYQWGYWTTNSDNERFFCCFRPDDTSITHWFRVPAAPESKGGEHG